MHVGKRMLCGTLSRLALLGWFTALPRITWMYCRPIPSYSRNTGLHASKRVDAMAYEDRR